MHHGDSGRKPPPTELDGRLSALLDLTAAHLLEIDGEDILLTESATACVTRTVESMLRDRPDLTLTFFDVERGEALFGGAYWVEETRDLVLCLRISHEQRYLVFDERQWRLRDISFH